MIRIIIADDHALIREGLRKVFSREKDIELVATAKDASEAVQLCAKHDVDVFVVDFNMPGRSGLELIARLKTLRPKLAVLVLSMMPERDVAVRAFKVGAAGFVSKESASDEIVNAVRKVATGARYVSPAVAEQLAQNLDANTHDVAHDALSDRELQVVRLIASGKRTREISEQLSLSISTIATYRRRIAEKLNLRSDVEITRYAIEHNLIV
tara:strand:+ start:34468 stop:35100 length:633 start_codon:yes stop_codon:yes gene_type:complete